MPSMSTNFKSTISAWFFFANEKKSSAVAITILLALCLRGVLCIRRRAIPRAA